MSPEDLKRARRGDPGSQELVISAVAPALLRLATRLVSDPAEREDLVEETLYRGIVKLRDLRDAEALPAWFRRILLNLWRDDRRRKASRPRALVLEDVQEPEARESGPESAVERGELRERVAAALDELPPAQRAAMVLRVDEGLSLREIAGLLNTTPDRVKANLYHARERLRAILGDLRSWIGG